MAYKGDRVGIAQMFDELVKARSDRHAAAVELGSALLDGAIALEFAGNPVIEEIVPIAQYLRDFVANPYKPPAGWAVARWFAVLQGAQGFRTAFEIACGLGTSSIESRITAEEACRALILRLKEGPRLARAAVLAKAKAEIPDLVDKEFDRAWRSAAGDWKAGGRPKKTLN
jgi:hypothetical protein